MIRKPFHSAIGGHTRADLTRVTDGIAASLREFSIAQQRAAAPDNRNGSDGSNGSNRGIDNNNNDNAISRPTGRQRAAAAVSDLMELNSGNPAQRPGGARGSGTAFRSLDLRSESAPGPVRRNRGNISLGESNVIRGGPAVPRTPSRIALGEANIINGGLPGSRPGGLRGGGLPGDFRGRGGFFRGGGAGRGGFGFGRGGFGGGFGGRGGRGGGAGRGGRGGRGRRDGEDGKDGDNGKAEDVGDSPEVLAIRLANEIGSTHQFDPSISKGQLAGWGPAVPTTGSTAANDDTVIRQARILGGGEYFHPLHKLPSEELWKRYKGDGVFFPTEEMKKLSADAMGLEAFPPVPKETKDAVLQAALLGAHEGPQYADRSDTLGTVLNYVKRDSSWNADAERRIQEKVRSLLPGGRTGPAGAAGGARV
ncbi:hypothetical protein F5X97DRAFT_148408 [Nemania serpens]|nr:hypothetical protein F5X97DRAFT_148408 [Nemania serpens]